MAARNSIVKGKTKVSASLYDSQLEYLESIDTSYSQAIQALINYCMENGVRLAKGKSGIKIT